MTGFVAKPPPADTAPPTARPPEVVACDGWWPDIDIVQLRDAVRLDTTIPTNRLRDSVRQAMLDMGRDLAAWRADQELAGHASLGDVPPRRTIDGQSDYVLLWARGIYSIVAADLSERLRGMSATAGGHDRADELQSETDEHRRNVIWAVRDFLGLTRVAVELV